MIDGLGFEEVEQSGLSTQLVQSVSGIHTRVVGTNVIGITDLSGLNIFAQGSVVGGVLNDADGAIKSVFQSQAADVFGMTVLAGSITTGDAQTAVVEFANGSFANGNYHFVMSPRQFTIPAVSGINWMSSGTRRASGLTVLGPSGTTFDWIAVGQR